MQIRQMELRDMGQVASLCKQWGYPARTEQVRERFQQIRQSLGHQLYVAEFDHVVCGWVHVHGVHSLASDLYAEVRGIVVDMNHRQQGVGRQLILQAEKWALENGCRIVRLRSGIDRPEAHHFYPKLGYDRTKSQYVYEKVLVDDWLIQS